MIVLDESRLMGFVFCLFIEREDESKSANGICGAAEVLGSRLSGASFNSADN